MVYLQAPHKKLATKSEALKPAPNLREQTTQQKNT